MDFCIDEAESIHFHQSEVNPVSARSSNNKKSKLGAERSSGAHREDAENLNAEASIISVDNRPLNSIASDEDFTEESYRGLLRLAKENYEFVFYSEIPWGKRFVLWRHDCDYSINRAHAIARLELSEGVRSTFFLNPHCAYYNLFEKSQYMLVKEIIEMGHQIGLHFDASFYGVSNEIQLCERLGAEAKILENLFCVRPESFSFHNPAASDLEHDAETYCGMVNCYSSRLKTEASYCSDSNGYWRFRRLEDVLRDAAEPSLQILTHPEWWQETAMSPRNRIFRCVHGRSIATMRLSDDQLRVLGRRNITGHASALDIFRSSSGNGFELYDILWNRGEFPTLLFELWKAHEIQLQKLSEAELLARFKISESEAARFMKKWCLLPAARLFEGISGRSVNDVCGVPPSVYHYWHMLCLRNTVETQDSGDVDREGVCVSLCEMIKSFYEWGLNQPFHFGGLSDFDASNLNVAAVQNAKKGSHRQEFGRGGDGVRVPHDEFLTDLAGFAAK